MKEQKEQGEQVGMDEEWEWTEDEWLPCPDCDFGQMHRVGRVFKCDKCGLNMLDYEYEEVKERIINRLRLKHG